MRDIKFRAWEKSRKEIIPVNNIDFKNKMINQNFAWRTFDEIELMQYTGLKDKNGMDIYEGDILKLWQGKGQDGRMRREYAYPLPVEYCEPWCQFVVHDKANKLKYGIWTDFAVYEVIGNIYENPELLSGKSAKGG